MKTFPLLSSLMIYTHLWRDQESFVYRHHDKVTVLRGSGVFLCKLTCDQSCAVAVLYSVVNLNSTLAVLS